MKYALRNFGENLTKGQICCEPVPTVQLDSHSKITIIKKRYGARYFTKYY